MQYSKFYLPFMVFIFLVITSQTCTEVLPNKCNNVEIFYGPLAESYGPTIDGNQHQRDRFFLGNLYYKSSALDFKAIRIDFDASSLETVIASAGISTSSNSNELVIQKSGSTNLSTTGNDFVQIATVAWRVKYTDFNYVFGKQKFTFYDGANQPFSQCQPSFIDPPSLYSYGNETIAKPLVGFTPPEPLLYDDIHISNNGQAAYICVDEGVLKQQASNISECTYKHLELRYQYMNENEMPINTIRNDILPRELIERILKVNKGTYNGDTWWCDNGDIISSKYCRSCGPQNSCRKLTFKM